MNLWKEFKEFAVRGNMIDIAVGVIIGTAFSKVMDVLVKQVIMPPLSLLTGGANLENRKLVLRQAGEGAQGAIEEVAVSYGLLFGAALDFLIISITIFAVVKLLNSMRRKAEDPKDTRVVTPKDIELLDRIGDLMETQIEELKKLNSQGDSGSTSTNHQ